MLRKKLAVLLTVALMALMICTVAGVASAQGGVRPSGRAWLRTPKHPALWDNSSFAVMLRSTTRSPPSRGSSAGSCRHHNGPS